MVKAFNNLIKLIIDLINYFCCWLLIFMKYCLHILGSHRSQNINAVTKLLLANVGRFIRNPYLNQVIHPILSIILLTSMLSSNSPIVTLLAEKAFRHNLCYLICIYSVDSLGLYWIEFLEHFNCSFEFYTWEFLVFW